MTNKTCMRNGCDKPATVVPHLIVPAMGWPIHFHTPCQIVIEIAACDEHFWDMDAQELLTDEVREAFTALLRSQSKTKPDFRRAQLNPLPIDSDDYKTLMARKPDA